MSLESFDVMAKDKIGMKEAPVTGRLTRKDYNSRSKSDRRPANKYRNWDNPINRRCLSLNYKSDRHSFDLHGKEPVNILHNTITATKDEMAARRLEIKYSSRSDHYRRPTDPLFHKKAGWKSLVFAERNMELVTEHRQIAESEKVMVYLSRSPGFGSSCLQWKFDFTSSDLRIDRFALRFAYDTSEDGNIRAYLKPDFRGDEELHDEAAKRVTLCSTQSVRHVPEVHGWRKFSLIVEMSCKRDPCVFHHTQLFQQQQAASFFEKEDKKYPFKIEITFL